MRIAVPSRHARLLALCGLSAALHLLCLELVARHGATETATVPGGEGPLVLRLAPARAAAAAGKPPAAAAAPSSGSPAERAAPAAPAATASSSATAPATPTDAPATLPDALAPVAAPPAPVTPAGSMEAPPAPLAAVSAASAPSATAVSDAVAGGAPSPGNTDVQALVRYRVRMPPPARLVYTLTRRGADGRESQPQTQPQMQPEAQPRQAWLDWRNDGERYTLEMDGVLGRASSSGVSSDEGILPQRYVERRAAGELVTGFDPAAHRIAFADGSAAPDAPGMQDRASLLMQLAGIGLARPSQVQGDIEIVVAGADRARVEHFVVIGQEQVETGAGSLAAWRLAQRSAPGEPRLEIWLAPQRGWLPVQLRLTDADGASVTQVLARQETAPAR